VAATARATAAAPHWSAKRRRETEADLRETDKVNPPYRWQAGCGNRFLTWHSHKSRAWELLEIMMGAPESELHTEGRVASPERRFSPIIDILEGVAGLPNQLAGEAISKVE
jgi:hypothetical protein